MELRMPTDFVFNFLPRTSYDFAFSNNQTLKCRICRQSEYLSDTDPARVEIYRLDFSTPLINRHEVLWFSYTLSFHEQNEQFQQIVDSLLNCAQLLMKYSRREQNRLTQINECLRCGKHVRSLEKLEENVQVFWINERRLLRVSDDICRFTTYDADADQSAILYCLTHGLNIAHDTEELVLTEDRREILDALSQFNLTFHDH